jgi:predicted metal-dependent hydrolase
MNIEGIQVEVIRKAILHLRITVYPPDGNVRLTAPLWASDEALRLAVLERLAWIKRHRERIAGQPRQAERRMTDGETHWFQGKPYLLVIRETPGREKVVLTDQGTMELTLRPGSEAEHRRSVLDRWLKKQLSLEIAGLVAKWEPILGVASEALGVRRMKTRWGSCNPRAKRLWFNLELAKKPRDCLEYVVVHELTHLLERRHDAHFKALMDQSLPEWRRIRRQLNSAPPRL